MTVVALALAVSPRAARADGCDALIASLIRATGASFAGRTGPLAVFRAADADRMSLDCIGREMVFRSAYRMPNRYYFVLIGLAAPPLLGADAIAVENLALRLHRAALDSALPQAGIVGRATLHCDASPAIDILTPSVLCRLAPAAARRGLSAKRRPG